MVTYIKLGGKERPLAFGYDVGIEYEIATGGNYMELMYTIIRQAETARDKFSNDDLHGVIASVSLLPLSTMVYYGLRFGHKEEHIEIDFSLGDVAKWVFSDNNVVQQCITLIFESLPKVSGAAPSDTKKKTTARPGSTGKALSKRRQQSA